MSPSPSAQAQAQSPGADPSLVGYWTFEEGTGITTADRSGNGLNAAFDNVGTWGGPTWTNLAFDSSGLSFDGVNDRVGLGNPTALRLTGAMTVSAWVNIRAFNTSGRIVSKQGASGSRGWALNVESGNGTTTPFRSGAFQIAPSGTTLIAVTTTGSLESNQWIHLCGVYEPGVALRLYVNGFLNNQLTANVPAAQFNPNLNVSIGARPTGNPDNPFNGLVDEVRVFNRALTEAEIQALPELTPRPIVFLTQPVSQTLTEARPAVFQATVSGSPPYAIQWLSNGVAIPDANSLVYRIPKVTPSMNGAAFSVAVSNPSHGATSSEAVLTVIEDDTPPALVSVGSVDGTTVGVCFSEEMDPLTAADHFYYSVNDAIVTVQQARLLADGKTVSLTLQAPDRVSGPFDVRVSFVTDLAGNEVAAGSSMSGGVAGLAPTDLNAPLQPGSTFSCNAGDFDLTAGGADLGGTADQGHVALQPVTGDFDVMARVVGLTAVNSITKAGLMVRATLDANSPTLHLLANPPVPSGRGWIEAGVRSIAGGTTAAWGTTVTDAVIPDVWLRLRRIGDRFAAFRGTDGATWSMMGEVTQVLSDPVWVGLAATARNNSAPATVARFRGYGTTLFDNVALTITMQPSDTSAALNSMVTFTAAAEGTGAPASELAYQWQRDDGAGGFIDISGANGSSLSFLVRPQHVGAQFRVRTYFAGLAETSATAALTVMPDVTPPTLVSVVARGNPNRVVILFSEAVDSSTAQDEFNYAITNELGEAVLITAAVLDPDGRTVTLTTESELSETVEYRLTVENVADLGAPANTVPAGTRATFSYTSLVGHWTFEEGSGITTADQSGSGFTGTLINGPGWVAGKTGSFALDFDGADDRVNVGNPDGLRITGAMTLAAWVSVDTIGGNGRIVTKGGGSGQRGWSLNLENYSAWVFQIASSPTVLISVAVTNIDLNAWIHVAGVYDPADPGGPVMKLYTNGVLGGTLTAGVPAVQSNSGQNVAIGARADGTTLFDGRIDDVRIHTRALTDAEIAALATIQPQFLPVTIVGDQIRLDWIGTGRLEWAPTATGLWNPVSPQPIGPPHFETLLPGENRFYRLNATP